MRCKDKAFKIICAVDLKAETSGKPFEKRIFNQQLFIFNYT